MVEENIDYQQAVYFKQSEIEIVGKIAESEERSISNWIRKVVREKLKEFKTADKLPEEIKG